MFCFWLRLLLDPYNIKYSFLGDSNGKEIIQDFSCGHNCTYCPDEPELKITMKITSMDKKSCSFTVEINEVEIRPTV